jgi:regulator of nucleoside diphosphate kinase
MTIRDAASGRNALPAIILSQGDHDRLVDLATAAMDRTPDVAAALLDEADRAEVVPTDALPPDVVAMYSFVAFRDDASGLTRRVQLVYPHEADIGAGRVSVLTQIGAALIGLREGQSIDCPTRDHPDRTITVLQVSRERLAG